nr:RNA-dependent RNA polymerase [Camellia cryptic virus 1]
MDHQFRGERQGLIELGTIPERRSREEFKVLVDPYAAEAIRVYVPYTFRQELEGWARSYYSLQQHVDAILAYQRQKLPEPTDDAWNQTKQHVLTEFRRMNQIDPISCKRFDDVKWIQSSAAGYGYIGRKGDNDNYSKAERTAVTIAEALDHARNYAPPALLDSTPVVALAGTQLSQIKVNSKVRTVWGEAFHNVLLEGLMTDPLIRLFKGVESFYFIGEDPLLAVPELMEEIIRPKDYVYMFDWSGFDASVQEWEIRFAFQCLESVLRFLSNVEAQIWRFLIELFIYGKMAGPTKVLYLKTQGIQFGSCFTNIIGSITKYVGIQYMFKRLTDRFGIVFSSGEDSLAGVETTQFIQMDTFDSICAPLLWKINIEKSEVSRKNENISFVSRTVKEYQNARNELACLRMFMYPESEVVYGDIYHERAKSICRESGTNARYTVKIAIYLKAKYGLDECLPTHVKVWDPSEWEARRISESESM